MDILMSVLFFIVLLVLIFSPIYCYLDDKKDYNNGICSNCGDKLYHFDVNSQGEDGYRCRKCDRTIWLSWYKPYKRDKNNFKFD
jgi:tRNA(Ile2) C34 agmatinyltransferase TiaS